MLMQFGHNLLAGPYDSDMHAPYQSLLERQM